MSFTLRIACPIFASVSVFVGSAVLADDFDDPGRAERIAVLIELLASRNPAPVERQGEIRVPKEYDRQAQAVVFLAIQGLLDEGEHAMDALISHFGDQRYSHSFNAISGTGNVTVGATSERIAAYLIRCYAGEMHTITRDQHAIWPFEDTDMNLSEWWKENRERGLLAIQKEAVDRAIRFFTTIDRKKASTPYIDGGRLDPEEFDKLRKENLAVLNRIKRTIEASGQTYRPKSFYPSFAVMDLLPWKIAAKNR